VSLEAPHQRRVPAPALLEGHFAGKVHGFSGLLPIIRIHEQGFAQVLRRSREAREHEHARVRRVL